jgi:hypothetical protein
MIAGDAGTRSSVLPATIGRARETRVYRNDQKAGKLSLTAPPARRQIAEREHDN